MFSSATLCSLNTATALITVFPVPEDETNEMWKWLCVPHQGVELMTMVIIIVDRV